MENGIISGASGTAYCPRSDDLNNVSPHSFSNHIITLTFPKGPAEGTEICAALLILRPPVKFHARSKLASFTVY